MAVVLRRLLALKSTPMPTPLSEIKKRNYKPRSKAEQAQVRPELALNDQQKAFVRAWAEGNSVKGAAKIAGFSDPDYGYQLVHRPNVRAMYEAVKVQYQQAAQLSREDVMHGLKDAIDMARLMSEPATMIAGWREIGRLCGYYEPKKIDVNVSVNGAVQLERMNKMSDAELLAIINKAAETEDEQSTELLEGPQNEA